jgi:hypothetical protein
VLYRGSFIQNTLKERRKAVDGHLIEACFRDKQKLGQEIIVCLAGENREVPYLDLRGRCFWLQ